MKEQSCKRADKYEPEPESIVHKSELGPNPKSDLMPKLGTKEPENYVIFKNMCKVIAHNKITRS